MSGNVGWPLILECVEAKYSSSECGTHLGVTVPSPLLGSGRIWVPGGGWRSPVGVGAQRH